MIESNESTAEFETTFPDVVHTYCAPGLEVTAQRMENFDVSFKVMLGEARMRESLVEVFNLGSSMSRTGNMTC